MDFRVFDLGLVDFEKSWRCQKEIFNQVKSGIFSSALVICQHYPVITMGRGAQRNNILAGESDLENRGIRIYKIERGGDVTYHGPGQIIVYPIFNLNYLKKDIHWYLRQLEDLIVDYLWDLGIKAERLINLTGVWVNNEKLASIGIAIRNWITFHGLSLNVKQNDLVNFELIRPCGMDIRMTSLGALLGKDIEIKKTKDEILQKFSSRFSFEFKNVLQEGVR